ncbi:peptidyl-prolyl cis-trans isomerase [Treponema vincentii]|uniref:peptidyl-prolyl cis-trans isomerase n=1 Tax=Treponema vincentii TaxID=69710 RepID=UPI003D8E64FE
MAGVKKNTLAIGSIIILVFSVITFVFIPAAGGQAGSNAKTMLGKWKNKRLDYTADGLFLREYRQLRSSAEMRGYLRSDNKAQQEFMERQIMRTAFNASMIQLAAQEEALNAGFYLPNKNINRALISFYTDSTGAYSEKLYNETSEQQRLAYRRQVIDYLTAQRYIEDNFGTYDNIFGLKTSSAETAFVQKMAEKERIFNYVVFEESQFPQEKIREYGEEHADLFAEHNLLMLTFTSQEDANKTAQALEKGEITFEDAVITNSTKVGTDSNGKLLSPYRTTVNRTFPESKDLDTVLKLGVDEVSPVVKTSYGYAIVKCTAPVTAADFTLTETKDRVFSYMKSNERGIIEDYLEQKAKTFAEAAKIGGFAHEASVNDLVVQTSNPITLNYGNAAILPQISAQSDSFFAAGIRNENFYKKAFALKTAEISEPILLGSNVLVLQLEEEKTGSEETQNDIATSYRQFASIWYYEYPLAMLAYQQLSWGQQTFIDFVLNSKNFTDNFNTVFN